MALLARHLGRLRQNRGLEQAERDKFKKKLLAQREALKAEGNVELEPIRRDGVDSGDDEDEQPLAEMNQIIASKRNQDRARTLKLIDEALALIYDDPEMYGLCEDCEEPIGKRLELMPWAKLCVKCQQLREAPRKGGTRKHLRDFS